ncbi:MAG: hypothetical protein R2697_16975 [Ilumatobacteraceae bacterium]
MCGGTRRAGTGGLGGAASGSCPAGPSGWIPTTPFEAATEILGGLAEEPPADLLEQVEAHDKNEDDVVCLATRSQKNPKAHWYEYPYFIVKDNNTAAG